MLLSSANGSRTLTRPGSSNSTPPRQQNAIARSPQHAGVPAAAALAAAGPSDSLPQLQQQQQQSSHSTRTCIAQQQEQQRRYSSNPRLLTAHIKRSNSWQQVSDLLSAAGAAANHIHLTAAVSHCAQLHQGSHKQQQQQQQLRFACSITDRLLHQHAAALELRHSANLVWALAVLSSGAATDPDSSSSREQRLQHLVEQLLELQTQQLQLPALQQQQSSGYGSSSSVPAGSTAVKPQDLANTVWALATLRQAPPEPWLCCFWGLSGKLLQHQQHQQQQQCCSLQELCNMAWAVAKLQLQPPGPWLHALLGATQHTLNAATTQGQQQPLTSPRNSTRSSSKQPVRLAQALSNLAYAVGKLGCRPSDDWVSVFFAASLPQLHNCSHVQLSMLLWGLAEWGPVAVTAAAAAAAAGGVSFEGWLPVYAACVQQQLPTYSDQALVNTAASCYKLLLLTQHACASTSSQQQQQQQRLVAMGAALQQLLGAVLETAAGRVQMLPVSSASALLWASAGMRGSQQQQQQGCSSSSGSIQSWLRGYIQAHMAHPTEAAAADVLQLLWLAAKLRECPASDAWLQQQCALLQQQLEHLTLAQLSKLTWSLAELLECTAAAADSGGGRASHSSSSSGTDHPQHQQQHEVVWQHLNSLACTLLQLLPQRLADMSPQELAESTAAAARIVAVLQHSLRQHGLICSVAEQQQQQQEWALQQAACVLLPVSAAAALPCTAALQPHHLELLAQAMRLLLKHSTPQLAPPAAAAAAAWGSGGVMSSQQLSAVHRWLRAAADAVAAAGLPAAATAQVSMQLLALGQAAVRVAARAAAAAAAATAAAASEEHAPSLHPARPASSSHHLEHQQQQQLQRQRQKHHDWHPVLEQLLSCVGQLEGEQALQAAECSVRLLVTLPRGCLCELLYALQAAIPSFSPHQLLRLLRLLPAWRVTPPAAVKAKQAVVHRWLSASRYVILLQQQQQQQQLGAAHGSSAGAAAAAAVAAASQLQFVVAAVLGLEAAHVRPLQPWLQFAASALVQHLSAHRLLAGQHSYHHHQQQQQQDASGAGPRSQAADMLLSLETLSRLVLALSRLGCQLEWDSWEAGVLLQATQDALSHMDRSQLVRVLHGLTKMGAVPDSTWLAAFYDRVEAAPGAFHVSGFGMVVWALAKSGAKPHPAWLAALLDSTYGWGGSTVAAAAGAAEPGTSGSGSNAASEQWTDSFPPVPQLQRQQQLRPQHLANMLCAFAKLGFTPGARWMSWFRAELERTSGGQLQELDHFHIEWAWQELNHQYRMAANSSNSGGAGSTAEGM